VYLGLFNLYYLKIFTYLRGGIILGIIGFIDFKSEHW